MNVATGMPIKVALDSEVRIRSVGQAIHGKTVDPIYSFDMLLIPAGTTVNGKVSAIDGVPEKTRVLDATDGNFSSTRLVHMGRRCQFTATFWRGGREVVYPKDMAMLIEIGTRDHKSAGSAARIQ